MQYSVRPWIEEQLIDTLFVLCFKALVVECPLLNWKVGCSSHGHWGRCRSAPWARAFASTAPAKSKKFRRRAAANCHKNQITVKKSKEASISLKSAPSSLQISTGELHMRPASNIPKTIQGSLPGSSTAALSKALLAMHKETVLHGFRQSVQRSNPATENQQ